MRGTKYPFAILFCLYLAFYFQTAYADEVEVPAGINVSFDLVTEKASPSVGVLAKFTYKNVTLAPIKFLKWGTPFEGRINSDLLLIEYEGSTLSYQGLHIKRAPATESDYIVIAPNEARSVTVDLLTAYEVNLKGDYTISLRHHGEADPTNIAEKNSALVFKLTDDRPITFKQTPTFNNCNDVPRFPSNRQARLDLSLVDAESISLRARNDLRDTPESQRGNAARYREWFGAYTPNRWDRIQGNFDRIYFAIRDRSFRFDCKDNETYFAAVFSNDPSTIFIGSAFWSAPRTGTDSKAGVIVHEVSHFNIIANTDDHVYGQSAARALANGQPNQAIDNADNHEFFAENTPFLSMPAPGTDPDPDPDSGPSAEPGTPDLVISTISTTNPNSRSNRTVGVTAVVSNTGESQSASTQVTLRLSEDDAISLDDLELEQAAVPALNTNATHEFMTDFRAPPEEGEFWVGVCVSPVNDETATGNNCSTGVPLLVEGRTIIAPLLQILLLDEDED